MNKVLKSKIVDVDVFKKSVSTFAADLSAWRLHDAKVGVDPEYVAWPRPSAAPMIQESVELRDGVVVENYEIIDDSPSPEQVLRAKKDALLTRVSQMEYAASAAAVPIGKRRLLSLREGDIRKADSDRHNEFVRADQARRFEIVQREAKKGTPTAEIIAAVGPEITAEDIAAYVEKTRHTEDAAFLDEQAERTAKLNAIVHHGAVLHDEIEDLTADSIDGWEPAPFPT